MKRALSLLAFFSVLLGGMFAFSGTGLAIPSTVYVDTLQPDWGSGVWSQYAGPPSYDGVSPGNTAVYMGREAGIIKAGLAPDPGDGQYWDDGLFAFKPNVTINQLAASPLTYDVVNQYGTNAVWMTIEIDTGPLFGDTPSGRSDNTKFQMVPASYGLTAYKTVDARTGTWFQWLDDAGTIDPTKPLTLNAIATDSHYTGLTVVRTYLRLGMGNSYGPGPNGTQAWVDKTSIGGVTYDFIVDDCDLSITKEAADSTVTAGDDVTYDITVKNEGVGNDACINPVITDNLLMSRLVCQSATIIDGDGLTPGTTSCTADSAAWGFSGSLLAGSQVVVRLLAKTDVAAIDYVISNQACAAAAAPGSTAPGDPVCATAPVTVFGLNIPVPGPGPNIPSFPSGPQAPGPFTLPTAPAPAVAPPTAPPPAPAPFSQVSPAEVVRQPAVIMPSTGDPSAQNYSPANLPALAILSSLAGILLLLGGFVTIRRRGEEES